MSSQDFTQQKADNYYNAPGAIEADFLTAPHISQIFGEILALFLAQHHTQGACALVELGPGLGTLMADMLRTLAYTHALGSNFTVHLVEKSPNLQAKQAELLKPFKQPITWHVDLSTLPHLPMYVVANEFFDALPIRQLSFTKGCWDSWEDSATYYIPDIPPQEADILEISSARWHTMDNLCLHLKQWGGCVIIIDYGPLFKFYGSTVQAIKNHKYVPLNEPGADISSHVSFATLTQQAHNHGLHVCEPMTQKYFLDTLGLRERTQQLKRLHPHQAATLERQYQRLAGDDRHPAGMGQLFKVLYATSSQKIC